MSNHGTFQDLIKETNARIGAVEALLTSPAPDRAGAPTRAVVYMRTGGLNNTAALTRQLQTCHETAKRHHLVIVSEVHDLGPGLLGADRPGWDRAMELLASPSADVLICADWSRISRRILDYRVVVETANRLRFTIMAGDEICTPDAAPGQDRGRQ